MLAHLALPGRAKPLKTVTLVALALLSAGLARTALAADTLPVGSLDARATGRVSSADVPPAGSMVSGMTVQTGDQILGDEALRMATSENEEPLLRDASRASVFLGSALTSSLELTLGMHGTYEHVRSERRDEVFPEAAGAGSEAQVAWRENLKQTGFAGASLLMKLRLLDQEGFRLALAPFFESGAGESATYSLTRSIGPKAGIMTIATYGAKGVGEVSLNAGYRYRDPEELGGITLRNELFYKAAVKAALSRQFSLFVAGDGRKLMVARNDDRDEETNKRTYRAEEAGELSGGFAVLLGDAELSAFGGSRLKQATGFGFGSTTYGAALSVSLGNYRGNRPRQSFAKEIEASEAEKAALARSKKPPAAKPVSTADEYPEMIGADIDPLTVLGPEGSPDFKDVPKRIEENKKAATVESEDARLERELKELKAADEKATKARDRQEKVDREKDRKQAVKKAKADDELMKEYMDEAKADADTLDGIDQDQMEWNGLE